jgi:hypothetical protein
LALGRELKPEELDGLLRSLSKDDRFCAVVAWLDRNREAFVNAGSRQEIAGDHGKLAHAQGSVHAMNTLAAQLANMFAPAPASGMPTSAPEE